MIDIIYIVDGCHRPTNITGGRAATCRVPTTRGLLQWPLRRQSWPPVAGRPSEATTATTRFCKNPRGTGYSTMEGIECTIQILNVLFKYLLEVSMVDNSNSK